MAGREALSLVGAICRSPSSGIHVSSPPGAQHVVLRTDAGSLDVHLSPLGFVADEVAGSRRTRFVVAAPGTAPIAVVARLRLLLDRYERSQAVADAAEVLACVAEALSGRGVRVARTPDSDELTVVRSERCVGAQLIVRGAALLIVRDFTTLLVGDCRRVRASDLADEVLRLLAPTESESRALRSELLGELRDRMSELSELRQVALTLVELARSVGHPTVADELLTTVRGVRDNVEWVETAQDRVTLAEVEAVTRSITHLAGAILSATEQLNEHQTQAVINSITDTPPPPPALITDWANAEAVSAQWMDWFGLGPAVVTQATRDGGVDVVSPAAVAQVKDHGKAVPAGPVREIFAIAQLEAKQALVFARAGFSKDAIAWAERAKVALFSFDLSGTLIPHTLAATTLMGRVGVGQDGTGNEPPLTH